MGAGRIIRILDAAAPNDNDVPANPHYSPTAAGAPPPHPRRGARSTPDPTMLAASGDPPGASRVGPGGPKPKCALRAHLPISGRAHLQSLATPSS